MSFEEHGTNLGFVVIGSIIMFLLYKLFSISAQTVKNSTKLELIEKQVSKLFEKIDEHLDELRQKK